MLARAATRAGRELAHRLRAPVPGARRPAHGPGAARRTRPGTTLTYLGTATTWRIRCCSAGAKAGCTVRVATPPGFEPIPQVVQRAEEIAAETGGSGRDPHDPEAAAAGADVLYTDVWASMGQEAEADERALVFPRVPARPEARGSSRTTDVVVLHCLPAHRGQEITAEVMDGPRSAVWDQAENRLHTQKALLLRLCSAWRVGRPRAPRPTTTSSGPAGVRRPARRSCPTTRSSRGPTRRRRARWAATRPTSPGLDLKRILAIPGVGQVDRREDPRRTSPPGSIPELEELRAQIPAGVREMTRVPGLRAEEGDGRCTRSSASPRSTSSRPRSTTTGSRGLKGFWRKTEENIARGIRAAAAPRAAGCW